MKRVFYLFATLSLVFAVAGCQSKEDKANKLIKEYMFKHLHDFKSYEVVETKVDTMYNLPIFDSECLEIVKSIKTHLSEAAKSDYDAASDERIMDIWRGGWSSTSHLEYMKAYRDWITHKIHANTERVSYLGMARELLRRVAELDTHEQIGWQVEHSFRSNTLSGNSSLDNYLFLIDKGFKTIIAAYDDDDEERKDANDIITSVLEDIKTPEQADTLISSLISSSKKLNEMFLKAW